MFIWCTILFMLGVSAFMDSLFNYGDIFRQINSVLFMFADWNSSSIFFRII